jgi:deazaflavin-dependent oxidoreductase (nitroreductase family)
MTDKDAGATADGAGWGRAGSICSPRRVMARTNFQSIAGRQVLYLTTVGRVTGLPREIEIWFVVHRERIYLFSEHREAAGWVRNIRRNAHVGVRIGRRRIEGIARVLDRRADRKLRDEVAAIADRKYGWGDGLPVEIAPER